MSRHHGNRSSSAARSTAAFRAGTIRGRYDGSSAAGGALRRRQRACPGGLRVVACGSRQT